MKLLHTADWHAGKVLMGRDRTPDLAHALEQMLTIVQEEAIQAFLLCGDIFDTYNPPIQARKTVYEFFLSLHRLNIPCIVISGNHDSMKMFESLKGILHLANVHVFDKPAAENCLKLTIGHEQLNIAALPYPSEHRLATIAKTDGIADQLQTYAEGVGNMLKKLAGQFPSHGVNIICAHLMVDGAVPGQTERPLSISETFAVPARMFPPEAQYIALGHVHKRQEMTASPAPAWYSGSPLHMDFGELKYPKGVNIVEVEAGTVAQVSFRELTPLHPLKEYRIDRAELEDTLSACETFDGLLKLRVRLEGPEPGLADTIRARLGHRLLALQLLNPDRHFERIDRQVEIHDPLQVYRSYYEFRQQELNPDVETAFKKLLEQISR